MANEGSTKPTYSERERAAQWKRAARGYRSDMLTALGNWRINRERAEAAEAENLRVRGLLQRMTAIIERRGDYRYWDEYAPYTALAQELNQYNQQGAESADIGKLDRVDEK